MLPCSSLKTKGQRWQFELVLPRSFNYGSASGTAFWSPVTYEEGRFFFNKLAIKCVYVNVKKTKKKPTTITSLRRKKWGETKWVGRAPSKMHVVIVLGVVWKAAFGHFLGFHHWLFLLLTWPASEIEAGLLIMRLFAESLGSRIFGECLWEEIS